MSAREGAANSLPLQPHSAQGGEDGLIESALRSMTDTHWFFLVTIWELDPEACVVGTRAGNPGTN
jgi:hypothetical protein